MRLHHRSLNRAHAKIPSCRRVAPSQVIAELTRMEQRMKEKGIYPVRDGVDLATTCMQTMMDANLALQIRMASGGEAVASHNGWLREGTWPRSWASIKVCRCRALCTLTRPHSSHLALQRAHSRLSFGRRWIRV